MIKIDRSPAPVELTPQVVAQKTAEFKKDNTQRVWGENYIKKALLEMSHGKCCYCEREVNGNGSYMEVEHFHPKDIYPDEVVKWGNLLPSCKRCNVRKRTHDTYKEPIVDPSVDTPQAHLILKNCFWFRAKDGIGQATIDVLSLADDEKLDIERMTASREMVKKVDEFFELANNLATGNLNCTTHLERKLQNGIVQLLTACQRDRPFTAVRVTTTLTDNHFAKLKDHMTNLGLWTQEMTDLEASMRPYLYDVV